MRREIGHGEALIGIDEVEPLVRDASAVRLADLGRPDIEAAVHLPRVG